MTNILTTNRLCKSFRGQAAVTDVTVSVRENSVYGLLGPNGAGKSTFLKMVSGMMTPTSGEMLFQGKPWQRNDLRKMGALIEAPPIYENLTAIQNLKVRSLLLDVPDRCIEEVLETVGLSDTGKKKAGRFSMGMKQRLGIAIALLGNPKLLILDEPTNGLDPVGIHELRELIRSFPAQGITVILSSHILSEVQLTADRIGIIAGGRLWVEQDNDPSCDLEALFMDIVKKAGSENA